MSLGAVETYLAAQPQAFQTPLTELRARLRFLVPEAVERMSYAMPGLQWRGKMVAGYAGFTRHMGFYPHSGQVIPSIAKDHPALLAGYKTSKSGVLFTVETPLSEALLSEIIARRMREIAG